MRTMMRLLLFIGVYASFAAGGTTPSVSVSFFGVALLLAMAAISVVRIRRRGEEELEIG